MTRRVREDNGDVADGFLRNLGDKQIADLDASLEHTVRQWLSRNGLEPAWVRVEAVGECVMPLVPSRNTNGQADEVTDIGSVDYSGV